MSQAPQKGRGGHCGLRAPSSRDCPPLLLTRPWHPDGWDEPRSLAPRGCQGRAERKERPGPDSAAHPPAPSAVSSILGTWLDQGSEDFCQPPDLPCLRQLVADLLLNIPGSDLERRAHLLLAQLEHADLSEAEPEGEAGWGTQGEQRLASDCPCGHHRRGPQSGTSGIGGGMFPIWKAGSGTSCSLTTSQDVEPPPAAAPTTRRPRSAAEAAADEAAPSQRHPISVWRDRQAGAPRAAPRRRLLPRRR